MRPRRFVVPGVVAALVFAVVPGVSASPPDGGPQRPDRPGSGPSAQASAQAVLAHAERAMRGQVRAAEARDGRGLTLALRDLVAAYDDLGPRDRSRAERLLARPDDEDLGPDDLIVYESGVEPVNTCEVAPTTPSSVCVHWVTESVDAPALQPADADGVPEYVASVREEFDHAWRRIVVEGGYRPPLPDTGGPDARLDVYLADLGGTGYYGYCTSDDPDLQSTNTASAYCVLDNDYAPEQYGYANTPRDTMRVTAAHEFFHAVHFAYDLWEDAWLMEASSAWVEDELYDHIDDNRQFLSESPLAEPSLPLDFASETWLGEYGAWIFLRYLSERFPEQDGTGMAVVVRDIWERVAARGDDPGDYSIRAVAKETASRGVRLPRLYQDFGIANRWPADSYEEGASYKRAPVEGRLKLDADDVRRVKRWPLHLSNTTIRVVPGRELTAKAWKARVRADLPPKRRGYGLAVTVVRRNGNVATRYVDLDADGDGRVKVRFSRKKIRRLELTLTNASRRFDCWQGTTASCQGVAKDDGRRVKLVVRAFR